MWLLILIILIFIGTIARAETNNKNEDNFRNFKIKNNYLIDAAVQPNCENRSMWCGESYCCIDNEINNWRG